MVFFLIFDILCLLASLGMSIMVALVITFWGTVNEKLAAGCSTDDWQLECKCGQWTMGKSTSFEIYTKQVENHPFPTAI